MARLAVLVLATLTVGCGAPVAPTPTATPMATAAGPTSPPPSAAPTFPPSASPGADVCSSEVVDFAEVVAMSEDEQLACFGGRTIRFDGFVAGFQYGGLCTIVPELGEGWLNPCGGYHHIVAPNGAVGGPVYLPPELSEADLPAARDVTIWAHFDDPAAASCGMVRGDAGIDPVTACRYLLVVEEVFVHPFEAHIVCGPFTDRDECELRAAHLLHFVAEEYPEATDVVKLEFTGRRSWQVTFANGEVAASTPAADP